MSDNTAFSRRLVKVMQDQGITQTELSRKTGLKPQNIHRYLNGAIPPLERLLAIKEVLGISLDYLLAGDVSSITESDIPDIVSVTLLDRITGNGTRELADGENATFDIPEHLVNGDRGSLFAFEVTDDSMINAGITVGSIAIARYRKEMDSGDIAVVILYDKEAMIRRVYFSDNNIVLKPENPAFTQITIPNEDANRVEIVGKLLVSVAQH